MDLELLKHAQGYIEKMAKGIHPLTGEMIPNNDIVNNIRISRCLFYVNDVLKEVIHNNGVKKSTSNKIPFDLSIEQLSQYDYNEDLSISKIVSKINILKTDDTMMKLKASQVCNWLVSIGILKFIEENGHKLKRPTEKGEQIGIYVEHVMNQFKEYDIVIYNTSAQKFIIHNFHYLLEFIKSK